MVADETVQAGFEQQAFIVHEVLVGVGSRAQFTLIQTTGLDYGSQSMSSTDGRGERKWSRTSAAAP
jgi:hypothetical protein